MAKVKDIMNANVITVDPEDTVDVVISRMIENGISGLPVVDMSGQLLGIVTEFDLLDIVWDPNTAKNKAYHYMTRDIHTADVHDAVVSVAEIFRELAVRRLIVLQDDQVVGVVSRRDLIRYVLRIRDECGEPMTADQ